MAVMDHRLEAGATQDCDQGSRVGIRCHTPELGRESLERLCEKGFTHQLIHAPAVGIRATRARLLRKRQADRDTSLCRDRPAVRKLC